MKILDLEYKKMELMCPCGDVLKPNPEEFEKGMLVFDCLGSGKRYIVLTHDMD